MARPRIEVNWAEVDKLCEAFARGLLQEVSGMNPLPGFINPVKRMRKIVRMLPKDEQAFWVGTPFLPPRRAPLEQRLKTAVNEWVRKHKAPNQSAFEFCGFSLQELKRHIESQFEPWMNWDNWGEWHIDHKIPRSRYGRPHTAEEVFGLKNLRPISRAENLQKANKYSG